MEYNMTRRGVLGLAAAGTAALALAPLEGCPTFATWVSTAEQDIPTIVDIAGVVVSIVATLTGNPEITPAATALITEAVNVFLASLKALSDAVTAYKGAQNSGTLAAVTAALNAVEQDAPGVIKAIVQAPANIISIITSAIGTALQLLSAIQNLIPSSTPVVTGNRVAVVPAKRVQVKNVKLPSRDVLRTGFNSTLSVYGYGQFSLK
jgi:hypothetical protein